MNPTTPNVTSLRGHGQADSQTQGASGTRSEHDADETDMSGSEGNITGYKVNALVTEDKPRPPYDHTSQTCKCKNGQCPRKGKGRKALCCSKYGKSCSPNCGCKGACDNIWNVEHKERLFGCSDRECSPTACFVHWWKEIENKDDMDMSGLLHIALEDYDSACGGDRKVDDFSKMWDALEDKPEKDPECKLLAQRLVRFAFTDDRDLLGEGESDDWGYWYSFCRYGGSWVSSEQTTHCWVCGECMDWRNWHCGKCKKCADDVSEACEGCGGVAHCYHRTMQVLSA